MAELNANLKQFLAKHDPAYIRQDVNQPYSRDLNPKARRFIITSAQNGTPVHEDFWACLLAAASHLDAEILVIPLRYRNATSVWSASQQNAEWYTHAVRPYLWNQRLALNANLVLLADIKTQPTAVDPLAGMDGVSGEFSGIVGHTKLRLRHVATPQNKTAKLLTTTGACTVENYVDARTGKIAEFHHSLNALLVELEPDGKRFYLRQLGYSKTARRIIDLDDAYNVGGYMRAPPALAGVGGDTHVDFMSPMVRDNRHREGGLLDTIRCKNWFEHDLVDAYTANPHHDRNPLIWLAMRLAQRDSIGEEIKRAGNHLAFIRDRHPKTIVHVVPSNHNDMPSRGVLAFMAGGLKAIPHISPINLEWLGLTVAEMARGCHMTETGTSYPAATQIWLRKMNLGARVLIPDDGASCMLGSIEHYMHGDAGPNGARGSLRNLARIGVKSWTAHDHTGGIFEGGWRVATGTELEADYTRGPGSWANMDGVTNADGKRQLVPHIKGPDGVGKFRL